jgi:Methylenetetrahydrofolate reductase
MHAPRRVDTHYLAAVLSARADVGRLEWILVLRRGRDDSRVVVRYQRARARRASATVPLMDLIRRVGEGRGEFLLFALTPPRLDSGRERVQEIADATLARLLPLNLDGLILYDIDEEAARNPDKRPFPFSPTLDPAHYLASSLRGWKGPVIVYRAVGKYASANLRSWLVAQDPARVMTVLVGAVSSKAQVATSLAHAQTLRREVNPRLTLSGVAIPERHSRQDDEHLRLLAKQEAGCRFFVTQVIYDVNAAKNLVSDYHYECAARGTVPVPIVFTFSVCGSMKTLEFLRWLGVDVPRWIENDLKHAADTLEASYDLAIAAAADLMAYCRALGAPFGINIESVSIRRVEIEASVRLAEQLRGLLRD